MGTFWMMFVRQKSTEPSASVALKPVHHIMSCPLSRDSFIHIMLDLLLYMFDLHNRRGNSERPRHGE